MIECSLSDVFDRVEDRPRLEVFPYAQSLFAFSLLFVLLWKLSIELFKEL